MDSPLNPLASAVRTDILHLDGVTKFSPNRRFATVYSEGSPADTVFFVDSGLIKTYKRGDDNKEIILQIVGPGEIFGEQALAAEHTRSIAAEVLQEGVIYVIPRDLFLAVCDRRLELWREISTILLERKRDLEKKIELLCLRDVEYRILYYMAQLAKLHSAKSTNGECSIPLSQGELASLIGATRETTSTTLNSLARRGVIRLGRRQLIVPSIDSVLAAADQRSKSKAAKVSS